MLIHQVATSELYRDSPTNVRLHWSLRDLIGAHMILEHTTEERERARKRTEQPGGVPHGV